MANWPGTTVVSLTVRLVGTIVTSGSGPVTVNSSAASVPSVKREVVQKVETWTTPEVAPHGTWV